MMKWVTSKKPGELCETVGPGCLCDEQLLPDGLFMPFRPGRHSLPAKTIGVIVSVFETKCYVIWNSGHIGWTNGKLLHIPDVKK
jgi:hypothetical protein